jgi:hypothetical protein
MPMEEPMAQVPAGVLVDAAGRQDLPTSDHTKYLNEKKSFDKDDAQVAEIREHYYDPASE